jgi:molybdopterin-guanine dinucleotide biosynthesis protein A
MGRPKHNLEVGGRTMAELAVAALEGQVERVVLVGSGEPAPGLHHLERLPDPAGISGPIAGVLAAMRWAPSAAWVVAACDMPRVSAEAVRWLIGRRRLGGYAVLPCVREGCVEPLLAVYEPPVLPVLEELVAAGTWGLRRLAGIGGVDCPIPPPDLWAAWESVNTLEQFHARSDLDVS